MADERMPEDMISWMMELGWGAHHDQWHFERRWDWFHALADRGEPSFPEAVAEAEAKGWARSPLQEGESGNGEDFLFMHRAMLQLLADNFPQSINYLRGWNTPPQDNADPDDPVVPDPLPNPAKEAFHPKMSEAITRIEARASEFASDDELGLFIQTAMRPVPGDPFRRTTDQAAGLHNYLHNRWSDGTSDINLGDPIVNIFNYRFWKLHGWIDHQWWRFRRGKGLSDRDGAYQAKLSYYVSMMSEGVHHHHFSEVMAANSHKKTRNFFAFDFPQ
ncbi:MAG: hypothetical protein QHC90_24315 [Shinella sp.]|nr:hypothetical protein [Shinella sp.]